MFGIRPVFLALLNKGIIVPCPDGPVRTPISPVKKASKPGEPVSWSMFLIHIQLWVRYHLEAHISLWLIWQTHLNSGSRSHLKASNTHEPDKMAVCKCEAHTKATDLVSQGNHRADLSAKSASQLPLSHTLQLVSGGLKDEILRCVISDHLSP